MRKFLFLLFFIVPGALAAAEGLPEPGQIFHPREDLLAVAGFETEKASNEELAKYARFGFALSEGRKLKHWKLRLSGNPKNTAGSLACGEKFCSMVQKGNLWGSAFLALDAAIPAQALRQKEHTLGIWAKGSGTLSLELEEYRGGKKAASRKFRYLVTETPQFLRTKPLSLKDPKTDSLKLNIAVYGDIEFGKPELSPVTPVDPAAEMVFYVPFDGGSAEALFSRGPTGVFGTAEPGPAVPGVAGEAFRIDGKRRMTPLGILRLPMGLQYSHPGRALTRESGTLEFWFRPLPEMLTKKRWEPFPLFSIGTRTWMWPDSEDFSLCLAKSGGKLRFEYREHVRLRRWPDGAPVKTAGSPCAEKKSSHIIADKKGFIGRWHHLAFTWAPERRRVFLDGQPVMTVEAKKDPCVSAPDPSLYLGCAALNQPFTASGDFDELKIYKNVRYRGAFSPRVEPPRFERFPREGKSAVPEGTDAAAFDWGDGDGKYRLEIKLRDGAPLIYSSRGAANTVLAESTPGCPVLTPTAVERASDRRKMKFQTRDVRMDCRVRRDPGKMRITVTLNKGDAPERVWLEQEITLRNLSRAWHTACDGFTSRPLLKPFRGFSYDDLQTALPLVGAWNDHTGVALALTPGNLVSRLSRGMESPDSLTLKLRTVLDAGDTVTWDFEVFPFAARYGITALIDRYHANHPEYFAFSGVDPRICANAAQTNVWNSAVFRKRSRTFSLSEINRRIRGRWCWYYWTGAATGNWSVDPELLKEFPPLNEPRVGDAFYHEAFRKNLRRELRNLQDMGVTPSLYISSWAEKRLVPAYRDSLVEPEETPNGVASWKNYWTQGVTDFIMFPSGVRYGAFLRRQAGRMLRQYPGTCSFSHDLFGGDHYFRKETTLGGMRAFDERGVYTHNLPAMGKFVDDLKKMRSASPFKTALVSNGHAQTGSFNTFFRADNNIHERPLTWTLQDWGNLAAHARMMGEKPTTFFNMPSHLGNYISAETDDIELVRYAMIFEQHSQLLFGMLFNINQNWSILGVAESIPMIDQLLYVHALGHRQTPGFSGNRSLARVRYGSPRSGALVLINFSPENRSSAIRPDTAYLGSVPLLCAEERTLEVRESAVNDIPVAPLSWRIVEMAAAAQTAEDLSYDARMTKCRAGRKMTFDFKKDAGALRLVIGLRAHERFISVTLNGKELPVRREGKDILVETPALAAGDRLEIATADSRWLMPVEKLGKISFLSGRIIAPPELENCGKRIVEFFRFWGVNQTPERKFDLQTAASPAKDGLVELKKSSRTGISFEDGRIVISAPDDRAVMDLTEEFLAALEKHYPYVGLFGNQMPVYDWDYAPMSAQRKLIKRAGLTRKRQSAGDAAKTFDRWLKKNGIRTGQGF